MARFLPLALAAVLFAFPASSQAPDCSNVELQANSALAEMGAQQDYFQTRSIQYAFRLEVALRKIQRLEAEYVELQASVEVHVEELE